MLSASSLIVLSLLIVGIQSQFIQTLVVNQSDILDQHNTQRTRYGLSNLVWDDNLALVAQNYTSKCTYAHNSLATQEYNQIANQTSGLVGENILAAKTNALISVWMSEEQDWICVNNTCTAVTPQTCDDWVQVIWENTTRVGCAKSLCGNATYPFTDTPSEWEFIVCYYDNGRKNGEAPIPQALCLNPQSPEPVPSSEPVPDQSPEPEPQQVPEPEIIPQPQTDVPGSEPPPETIPSPQPVTPIPPVPAPNQPVPSVPSVPSPNSQPPQPQSPVTPQPQNNPQPAVPNPPGVIPQKDLVYSFKLKQTDSNSTLSVTEIEAQLVMILSDAINVDPKYLDIELTPTSDGYQADIYSVNYPNDPIPTADNTDNLLAEALFSDTVENDILSKTQLQVDKSSLSTDTPPNKYSLTDSVLGIPIYAWIVIGVGIVLVIIGLGVFIFMRRRERERKPWQEFV
jgi:hypothetical protein